MKNITNIILQAFIKTKQQNKKRDKIMMIKY